jgi:hypothetical protein
MKTFKQYAEQSVDERLWYDQIAGFFKRKLYSKDFEDAVKTLHDVIIRKQKENKGKLAHSIEYYASAIAKTYANVEGGDLADLYVEIFPSNGKART